MTTTALQKELHKIAKRQENLARDLKNVMTAFSLQEEERDLPYGDWELKPSAIKRIKKAQQEFAEGKGIVLRDRAELKKFFQEIRDGK